MNEIQTDFLFATPSFVSGAARLLDWHCLYDSYNESHTGYEADYKALLSDWYLVGQDIRTALGEFDRQLHAGKVSRSEVSSTSLSHK